MIGKAKHIQTERTVDIKTTTRNIKESKEKQKSINHVSLFFYYSIIVNNKSQLDLFDGLCQEKMKEKDTGCFKKSMHSWGN